VEAEEVLKHALVTREQALGAKHPDVGQTLNNLALVYRDQGKPEEAEGLFKRALTIRGAGARREPSRRGADPRQHGDPL
jgi:tetratricopeptide (TPR) repeat protein